MADLEQDVEKGEKHKEHSVLPWSYVHYYVYLQTGLNIACVAIRVDAMLPGVLGKILHCIRWWVVVMGGK